MTNKHVHLIGIGGTGLSAIALVLLERGYEVSGSDRTLSEFTQQVQEAGAHIFIGHSAENMKGAELVLRSSAIPDDNVEVLAARAAGIPVLKRSDFLEELTAGKRVIAIAGTHGKTTCTAMTAWLLKELGQDPSYIIGGRSKNLGNNAHAGHGAYFVIEADEYDHMFWGLRPDIALVTNVEHDHPDYYPTAKEFFQAFLGFIERIKPGGVLVTCENDPGAALLRIQAEEKNILTISYGLYGTHYECYAQNVVINTSGGYAFEATCAPLDGESGTQSMQVNLQVPGEYNVRNALATLAVAHALGLPLHQAALALNNYEGTERRFEIIGQACGVILIDDYAHHPTEIRATIGAAREQYPTHSLWVVWQPHTYSRTRTLLDQYLTAFESAHHVLATEVYAAREAVPADNFSTQQITQAMNHNDVEFVPDLDAAKETLLRRLGSHDVLLVLSAGDADQLNQALLAELLAREDTGLKNNLNYQNINNYNVN